MNTPAYDKDVTALLVVDPYNDFISEGGKIWPRIKSIAEANNCVDHMLEVLNAARNAKLRVFYAMHRRYARVTMRRGNILAHSERGLATQDLRIRYMGWRVPRRIRAGARRNCSSRALVLERLCQHGP